jgi:hypothetical protein
MSQCNFADISLLQLVPSTPYQIILELTAYEMNITNNYTFLYRVLLSPPPKKDIKKFELIFANNI